MTIKLKEVAELWLRVERVAMLGELSDELEGLSGQWVQLLRRQEDPLLDVGETEEGREILRRKAEVEAEIERLRWKPTDEATEWEKGKIWGSYEDALVTLEATSGIRAGTCETVREMGLTQIPCCENCHIDGDF